MSASDRRWYLLAGLVVIVGAGIAIGPALYSSWAGARLARLSEAQLRSRLDTRPDDVDSRYTLAKRYGREGRHAEAARELLVVLEAEPHRADALNDLGVSYLLQQRYYESLIALQGALVANPNSATVYANLGRLHIATRMPFTALEELKRAADLEPRNVDTLLDLGAAHQETLQHEAALRVYDRVKMLDRKNLRATVSRGTVLIDLTRYEEAEAELNYALGIDPDSAAALHMLGRLKLERGATPDDLTAAEAYFVRGARLEPQNSEILFDRGRLELRRGNPMAASKYFLDVLRIAPDHAAATMQLGRAFRGLGRHADADRVDGIFRRMSLREREISRLEEWMLSHRDDLESCAALTGLYIEGGDLGLAAMNLQGLRQSRPDHPKVAELQRKLDERLAQQARHARGAAGGPRPHSVYRRGM